MNSEARIDDDQRSSVTRFGKIARVLFGLVLIAIGLTLAIGGVMLAFLGGSFYYAVAGALLLTAGVIFCLGRALGFYIYTAAFLFTLLWSLWESGLNGWALTPRLAGPLVLMVLALLLVPTLALADARRVRNLGLASVGVLVVLLGVGVSMATRYPLRMPLPAQQASLAYDASANSPLKGEWDAYGGGASAQRYSDSTQINLENVKDLKRAWVFHVGGLNEKYGTEMTPLKIGNRMYGCSGMNVMFALDPATGQKIWSYDPHVGTNYIPYTAACRGVAYYKVPNAPAGQPCGERIIEGTLDMRLIAVDATTGAPCAGFGHDGQANLQIGLGQKDSLNGKPGPMIPGTASITATPVIVQGVIVTGQEVLDGQRRWAPSGVIRGYDAVTGQLRFAWDVNNPAVTKDPPAGGYYSFGTPNSWTASVGDEKLGLVYVPMGNSAGDYYTSLRSPAENAVSSSIVALDVHTGKPRWVFQTVHKDVWDYDIGSQPSLVEFPVGGRTVPALVVPSKQGEIYVLDRATGRSLQRVEERPVPQGGAEPSQRSPTQPFSTYHTLAQADLKESDMWGLSPIDQMMCRIQFRRARYEGRYTPPELNRANIEWPGYNGGSDWGSIAIDPRRGVIIANYNDTSNSDMLVTREKADQLGLFPAGDPRAAHSSSSAEGAGAMEATPYAILVNAGWQMPTKTLCTQPPYGGIRAIDLATGKTIWDRPFGTARANGPFGLPSYLPLNIGTPNNGGAVVTASGLIFIAAATDNLIRAVDIRTGKTVWSDVLPGGGQANPMIYEQGGREYLVIMAGGHHFMKTPQSDELVAYALPNRS
jgi:quinoprotein glucose dehydrogenase